MPPATLTCRFCGSTPAAAGTFRAHQGIILVMRFISLKGPFCRDCGISTFRRMTASTLLQGWWGLASFFITPFIILFNLFRRGRFARLAPPQRDLRVSADVDAPMDPGRPLYTRPAMLGLLVPVAVLAFVITSVASDSAPAQVGKCVAVTPSASGGGDTATLVDCDQPHMGKVISVADNVDLCPAEVEGAVDWDNGKVLCVARD